MCVPNQMGSMTQALLNVCPFWLSGQNLEAAFSGSEIFFVEWMPISFLRLKSRSSTIRVRNISLKIKEPLISEDSLFSKLGNVIV